MKNYMITILCAAVIAFVWSSSDVRAEWEFQKSGVTENLNDVCFVDEYHGWAVGDNSTIITTTDGGETWVRQECPVDSLKLEKVFFINETVGYSIGDIGLHKTSFTDWHSKNLVQKI